ncbi:MAG: sugar transferase [Verrucomicrobiota bacterium]
MNQSVLASTDEIASFRNVLTPSKEKQNIDWHLGDLSWIVIDFLSGFYAYWSAFLLSPHHQSLIGVDPYQHLAPFSGSVLFAIFLVLSAQVFGLHDANYKNNALRLLLRCCACVLTAILILMIGAFLISYSRIGRFIVVLTFFNASLVMMTIRMTIMNFTKENQRKILLIGTGRFFHNVYALIRSSEMPITVLATLNTEDLNQEIENASDPQIIFQKFENKIADLNVSEIVVESSKSIPLFMHAKIGECFLSGVQVSSVEAFTERLWQMIPVDHIDYAWLHNLNLRFSHPFYYQIKRILDITMAFMGSILSFPLLMIAGLLIKLQDGGPIFYSQMRIGRFGKSFKLYKLRTMSIEAEKNGAQWARLHDSRVTRFGKFLRKTRIDEIPQFWNVLRDEMSFVGPRPERPEFVEILQKEIPFYNFRHLVKPGITGWAQVNYSYGASIEDAKNKLCYDLFYIKNFSSVSDLQIMLKTIGVLMKGSR